MGINIDGVIRNNLLFTNNIVPVIDNVEDARNILEQCATNKVILQTKTQKTNVMTNFVLERNYQNRDNRRNQKIQALGHNHTGIIRQVIIAYGAEILISTKANANKLEMTQHKMAISIIRLKLQTEGKPQKFERKKSGGNRRKNHKIKVKLSWASCKTQR